MNLLMHSPPAQLREALAWEIIETVGPEFGGRISFWEDPRFDFNYAIGADFAYGIQGKDYDTAVVLRVEETRYVQVAEAMGRWGEKFDPILYALGMLYNYAWICGERQVGLFALRRLLREFGYQNLWYEADEVRKGLPVTDKLGYAAGTLQLPIKRLRTIITGRDDVKLVIRSADNRNQLRKFAFVPRTKTMLPEDAMDADLKMKASVGFDDLVFADAYGVYMADRVETLDPIPLEYAPGTLGEILQHREAMEEEEKNDQPDPFRRYGRSPG